MYLTKLGHSCFRIESGGTTLVLDPGVWSDPNALDGAVQGHADTQYAF